MNGVGWMPRGGWQERLRGTPECIRPDSKPNVTQMHDVHKTGSNIALIYTTQLNEIHTIGLEIGVDINTRLWTHPITKPATTQNYPPSIRPIELDRLRAIRIEPTTNHT